MPAQLLATGITEASSSDQTVAAGGALTVCLKDGEGPEVGGSPVVWIQLKDDAGQYFTIDELNAHKRALVITAPGVYRVLRKAGDSCGVFSG